MTDSEQKPLRRILCQDDDYDWVSEDEDELDLLDLASVDDWEVSSAADTASTAASTVEAAPSAAKAVGAKAWELALEQAALVAKRLRGWAIGGGHVTGGGLWLVILRMVFFQ